MSCSFCQGISLDDKDKIIFATKHCRVVWMSSTMFSIITTKHIPAAKMLNEKEILLDVYYCREVLIDTLAQISLANNNPQHVNTNQANNTHANMKRWMQVNNINDDKSYHSVYIYESYPLPMTIVDFTIYDMQKFMFEKKIIILENLIFSNIKKLVETKIIIQDE